MEPLVKKDLEELYKSYRKFLKGAKEGEVVTRFPPEPSGYLHIGHIKAANLNYHYAKMFKGKMIMRFDDTNPAKEKPEFEEAILKDLESLDIIPDKMVRTSDHFDAIIERATEMVSKGLAYCDKSTGDEIAEQRAKFQPSKFRDTTPEENLAIWKSMLEGENKEFALRAKIDYKSKNGTMRDPVIFRHCETPHQTTGTKYKVYPTYDFACPIVDHLDGVTHAMRTNEYADRIPQYQWFLQKMQLRDIHIHEYSRLNFIFTTLSKRKLNLLVDKKVVSGWDDPRFPTVRGVLRRGMLVISLIEFMLEQGPSKNTNLMEWDRIWATNRKYLDPIALKFTGIPIDQSSEIEIENVADDFREVEDVALHPKLPEAGTKKLVKTKKVLIESGDAATLKVGDKIALMKWGICTVTATAPCEENPKNFKLKATIDLNDKNFKDPVKLTWLTAEKASLAEVELQEFDHILKVEKPDDVENFDDAINHDSKFVTRFYSDLDILKLPPKSYIQFERRCYAILDAKTQDAGKTDCQFILIPDGKTKTTSGLSSKVNPEDISKGKKIEGELDKKEKKEKKKANDAKLEEAKEGQDKKAKKKEEEAANKECPAEKKECEKKECEQKECEKKECEKKECEKKECEKKECEKKECEKKECEKKECEKKECEQKECEKKECEKTCEEAKKCEPSA